MNKSLAPLVIFNPQFFRKDGHSDYLYVSSYFKARISTLEFQSFIPIVAGVDLYCWSSYIELIKRKGYKNRAQVAASVPCCCWKAV